MRYFTWVLLRNSGYIIYKSDPFISSLEPNLYSTLAKQNPLILYTWLSTNFFFCLILHILLNSGSWNFIIHLPFKWPHLISLFLSYSLGNSPVTFSYTCFLSPCLFLCLQCPLNGSLSDLSRTAVSSMWIFNQGTLWILTPLRTNSTAMFSIVIAVHSTVLHIWRLLGE